MFPSGSIFTRGRSAHFAVLILSFLLCGTSSSRAQSASSLPDFESTHPLLKREYHFEYFTAEEGLSNNDCQTLLVDRQGYLWIGTRDGLNRFDGLTFTVYRNIPADSTSISGNLISCLLEDTSGSLWVGTYASGLNLFDRDRNNFLRCTSDPNDTTRLVDIHEMTIPGMYEDRKGRVWAWMFGSVSHIVREPGAANKAVIKFTQYQHNPDSLVLSAFTGPAYYREDSSSFLITDIRQQLTRLDLDNGRYSYVAHDPLIPGALRGKTLIHAIEDRSGLLWCATPEGIFNYDRKRQLLVHIRNDSTDPVSSAPNHLFEDREGTIWATTGAAGIVQYDPRTEKFVRHRYEKNDPNSFRGTVVKPTIAEDSAGNLWIPTWTQGVGLAKLTRRARQFKHFLASSNADDNQQTKALLEDRRGALWVNGRALSPGPMQRGQSHGGHFRSAVISMCEDSSGFLWIGTEGDGLHRLDPQTGRVTSYPRTSGSSRGDGGDQLYAIVPDPAGYLWLGTYGGGLDKFDLRAMRYAKNFHHNPSDGNSINNNRPVAIHRDGQGIIWIGTEGGGLNRLDPSDETFKYWRYDPRDSTSIAGDIVYVLADDGKGHLWVGTDNGVCRFDKNSRTFRRYFRGSGELSNLVLAIVVDGGGKIWIGYRDNGLSQLDPETGEFRNFTRKDGLPADRFSFNSQSYRRRNGEIVMGTQNGILVFTPEGILENTHVPGIALRSFNIFGKEIPIQKAVERSEQVVLSYDENFFTFAFAALDLTDPSRNQLACKLDGLEDRWTFLGTRREARYTNLSPGEYVFRVKGSNNDGVWNEQGTSLKIVILPPWWRTAWAYLGYGIAFGGMLYTIRRSEKNRERLRHRAELAHTRAKTLEELDAMKSRFFANISHEFRTPLTLIAGPARQILAGEPNFDAKENAGIIVRNSQRLLTLVNQLLDLSKLESGNLILHAGEIDIADVAKGMVASFESMAATKRIHLSLALAQESIVGWFDRDAIEKILANLLSNAFKFTGNGGRVNVKIQIVPDGRSGGDAPVSSHVEIVVSDTGIGIGEEHLDKIFDRFYQVDVSPARGHEGTGIGLALTKEFVELHQGQISVASEVGGGTSFTVLLPLGAEHRSPGTIAPASVPSGASMAQSSIGDAEIGPRSADNEPDPDSRAPLLLIVEDNTDMRKYIRNYIDGRYRVVEAQDGAEGVEKAVELIPDLIISDVMMPNIEGFELCRRLKTDERTSHIPIILLTAKAGSENKLEGLSTGADDYLVKPFDAKELQMRVKNLIEGRRRLREKFEQSMTLKPGELKVSSMDDAFLQRAMTVVEQHMGDEHFSVDKFSEDMNMSRVQLHRKLKALTNLAASDFVRTMRLQRAMNLLQQDAATIAEISFMVGFGSPAYFTKCFREQFGCPPSEVIKRTPPRMPGHPPGTD